MSDVADDIDATRRYEISLVFLAGAVYLAIVTVIQLATLKEPLTSPTSLLLLFLSLALAARYVLWCRMSFYAPSREMLHWLFLGVGLTLAIAVLLQGRASFYYFLVLAEGGLAFFERGYRLAWMVGVVAGSFVVFLAFLGWPAGGLTLLEALPVYILLAVAVELMFHQDVKREQVQRLLVELRQAHRRLEDYTAQAESLAVAQERARLARDIHDTLGHTLTALDVQLELLARLPIGQAESRETVVEQSRALVKDGLVELRRAVRALRPGALETFSLSEALADLVRGFRERTGIEVIYHNEGEVAFLPPNQGVPLYRAAQEALTNVGRHAQANRVEVTLRFAPDTVVLAVEDNGVGGQAEPGFGLSGLHERAKALGGEFHAGPGPERGFRLEMKLPR